MQSLGEDVRLPTIFGPSLATSLGAYRHTYPMTCLWLDVPVEIDTEGSNCGRAKGMAGDELEVGA